MKVIKVKYFKDGCKVERHGDWIDLKAAEDVKLRAGDYAQIPLGVAMKLPKGYEAHLVPRSSTFRKYGVLQTNGVGIIDGDYCGDADEWAMPVYATRDVMIREGARIAQFRIFPVMEDDVITHTVDRLGGVSRGGFGSSGD